MAMVEIDETELANFRSVKGALDKMLGNAKSRKLVLQAQKALNPDVPIPELDAAAPVMDELKAMRDEIAAFKTETSKEKDDRETAEKLRTITDGWNKTQAIARDAGYTDEGLKKLEKFMEDNGVVNHEIAIPAFERLYPPEKPITPVNASYMNLFSPDARKEDVTKMLFEGNDQGFLDTVLPQVFADSRGVGMKR